MACFPFDDHNCPPIQLVISFCHSAYSWLKEDIENVVVVHCKAGKARTGLMISSLLLFLKVKLSCTCIPIRITPATTSLPIFLHLEFLFFSFCNGQFFPTAEESIEYYNQKRCVDGKGLILPSQIVSDPHCYTHVYSYNFIFILFWICWKIAEICEVFRAHLNLLQWWKSAATQVFIPFEPWCQYDMHVYCA